MISEQISHIIGYDLIVFDTIPYIKTRCIDTFLGSQFRHTVYCVLCTLYCVLCTAFCVLCSFTLFYLLFHHDSDAAKFCFGFFFVPYSRRSNNDGREIVNLLNQQSSVTKLQTKTTNVLSLSFFWVKSEA